MTADGDRDTELSPLKRAFIAIEQLEARLEAADRASHQPIAIVGIGCRLPGGVTDPDALWALLRDGVDAITEVPRERWDIDEYYDPDVHAPGKMSTRHGGFVGDVDQFDAALFGIAPREADAMDPQQRILLEVAWEALERGGQAPAALAGTRTGVFVGVTGGDYAQLTLRTQGVEGLGAYYASGIAHSIVSGRLSYVLGLEGPSISLDTACSSSLVAVHLAVQSLRLGECGLALAGGVNLILSPEPSITLSKYQMMAPDGRCKFGDARADGFVRAEGCAVVVLKRLADAEADGDRILAVIRGSAVSQDGASSGLTAPSGPAQEAVIRAALADAGVSSRDVSYVEAHGTGTALGDPMEVQALGAVYGAGRPVGQPLAVGSLKTNLGHMEAAAGIGGLVKLAVMMEHGAIPASLHFRDPSPHIAWDELPVTVPVALQPWSPPGDRRLAGVSSFGFSGTNVHLVVEGPPERPAVATDERPLQLLALSARSDAALADLAGRYADQLRRQPGVDLADVAATAGTGRSQFRHRLAAVATDAAAAADQLAAFASGEQAPGLAIGTFERSDPPKVAFLFAGQGAQYAGMGRALYSTESVFRAALDRCADILDDRLERPLLDLLFAEPGSESARLLDQTGCTQPALVALEHALAELWRSWGITPSAVVGHSVGEYSAAILAGVLSLEDGLALVAERGRLMQNLPAGGAMAAIFSAPADVDAALAGHGDAVTIAARNGPAHVVISGLAAAVDAVVERFAASGVRTQRLNVSHAFHSPLLDPMLDDLERAAGAVALRAPRVRLISNLTGEAAGAEVASAAYWRRHARDAVRFEDGVQHLARIGCEMFVDIGPHPTSIGMAQAVLAPGTGLWLPSLRKGRDDWQQLFDSLARLYTAGATVNWAGVHRPRSRRTVVLPTYPFERRRHWIAPGRPERTRRPVAGHPLLGARLRSALPQAQFEQELSTASADFVGDHQVFGTTILPGTGFIELALAAGAALGLPPALRDVEVLTPLVVDDEATTVQTILTPDAHGAVFEILSQAPGTPSWQLHARGRVEGAPPVLAPTEPGTRHRPRARSVTAAEHYDRMRAHGLDFGPSLHGIEQVACDEREAVAELHLPADPGPYVLHPALLDAALQSLASLMVEEDATYLPFGFDRITVAAAGVRPARAWAHLAIRAGGPADILSGDLDLVDDGGALIARVEGMRLKRAGREVIAGLRRVATDDWLLRLDWTPTGAPAAVVAPVELPAPAAVVAATAPATAGGLDDLRQLQRLYESLDAISGAHVVEALRQLGASLGEGQRIAPGDLDVAPQHQRLLQRLLAGLAADGILRPDADGWLVMRSPAPTDTGLRWSALAAEHQAGEVRITRRCAENLADALRGRIDPLQLLFPGGSTEDAEEMYRHSPSARYYNALAASAVAAAASSLPAGRPLRVLEIGGGTGGTTTQVLPMLAGLAVEYTFTDISPLFVARAGETFRAHPGVTFSVLDIEGDPEAQGFAAHGYDVVLAANVLHATTDLRRTFAHVARLLAPGGLLMLLEMTKPQRFIDISFGLTPGWWKFTDRDVRPDYVLLDRDGWLRFLADAGFGEPAAAPAPLSVAGVDLSLQTLLVARAPVARPHHGAWLVLADGTGVGEAVAELVAASGADVTVATAGRGFRRTGPQRYEIDPTAADQVAQLVAAAPPGGWAGVVHLWSLDPAAATPERTQARRTGSAVSLVQAVLAGATAPKLWLVTRGAQAGIGGAPDPAQAPLWGLGRAIALEHPELRCTRVDLDPAPGPDAARDLAVELGGVDGDDQVVLRAGTRSVARLVPAPEAAHAPGPAAAVQVELAGSGVLDEIRVGPATRRPPGPGEIEIRVHAAGLNFRDVMNALGMRTDDSAAGSECAGVIVAVGPGVTSLAVGDAVVAVAAGSFGTYATTTAELVARKPARLTFAEAATIPLAFLTAHQALHGQAAVTAGDVVLIHAAAGGVGLAAVQLARRAGAVVMGTAGSAHKRAYLRQLGVSPVMDSRTLEFADEVQAATRGRGADVVVNSLTGAAIGRSLDVLAPGGRFVELGKREVWSGDQVAARAPHATYATVPLADDIEQRPAAVGPLLRDLVAAVDRGELEPLPVQAFALNDAAAAFRYMAQARHIGKVVLVDPEAEAEADGGGPALVRPGSTYLVTGGLTGLGLLVAEWLAGHGATHLAVLGRRPPGEAARETLDRLRAGGTDVLVVQADVSDRPALAAALATIDAQLPPLRGIIHAAGVLDDGALVRQDWSRFATVLAPKVDGATYLHELTEGLDLDHFVLFSSAASLFGSRGQANHAAANSFLDALAADRRAHGQPGLSINWGAWSDVGSVVTYGVEQRAGAEGIATMTPAQGLEVLGALMAQGRPQVGVVPMDWPTYLRQFGGAVPPWLSEMARRERRLTAPAASAPVAVIRDELAVAPAGLRPQLLLDFVAAQVARVLGAASADGISEQQPLNEMGLDSLMAVELRNLLGAGLGVDQPLPATLVFDHPTVEALARYLDRTVLGGGEPDVGAEPAETDEGGSAVEDLLASIELMSDDDVARMFGD